MFGYDFVADLAALKLSDPPRVDLKQPAESLILNKPISEDDHGGGRRFETGGWEERVLRRWIEAGAKPPAGNAKLAQLVVTPSELPFDATNNQAQLRVVAHWSDGTVEDVTDVTRYSSNDDATATIDLDGRVKSTGAGSTYVIACYDSAVASVPVVRPVSDRVGPNYPNIPTPTKIDELVVAKLRKLGIVQADTCTDAEFLRRASIDVCGTLPSPAEVEAFLADESLDKRARKIDELLQRPEYAVWWTTLLCDLTGLNSGAELGNTDYAKDAGEQWFAWLHRRVRENVGYDEIARGIILAVSRKPGQSYDDYVAEQVSYLRKKHPVDFSAQPHMPYYWFRGNLGTAEEKALSFAHVFMGVRLDCAQCHKHPFDRWSQQDFFDFTALFGRVSKGVHPDAAEDKKRLEERLEVAKLKNAAERRQTFRRWAGEGKPAPFYEVYLAPPDMKRKKKDEVPLGTPRILGGEEVPETAELDPRAPLMDWLLEKDNPYFAPAFVNRVWEHYFGVGIVSPVDDFNLGNPPSNRELIEWLADDFIAHGFDVKRLHRTILNSRTYQLSWRPNDTNRADERLFSRAMIRRLPAEVVVDAVRQATAAPLPPKKAAELAGTVAATRYITQQPPAYEGRMEYSMLVFGKPIRKTNCDCERQTEPSLLQSVYLRNDADMQAALARADGWLKKLPAKAEPSALIREAYLRIVSRPPTDVERDRCLKHFSQVTDPAEALTEIVWALLNTQEFVTNH